MGIDQVFNHSREEQKARKLAELYGEACKLNRNTAITIHNMQQAENDVEIEIANLQERIKEYSQQLDINRVQLNSIDDKIATVKRGEFN